MRPVKSATAPLRDGRHARWDEHRRRRRRSLLRATREAVHDLGPHASMEEIAAHAGTSKSVFYRYFGDKAGLQTAVSQEAIALMERRLLEAVDTSDDPPRALHAMVETYLRMADSSPHVYAFSVQSPAGAEDSAGEHAILHGFFERMHVALEERLRAQLASGGIEPPAAGHPLLLWPIAALGMVRAAGETWLSSSGEPHRATAEQTAAQITRWLLNGLSGSTRPSPSPTNRSTS
ncbi:TetR/AcrR family transcriptional regulator [Micrococcus luteus]